MPDLRRRGRRRARPRRSRSRCCASCASSSTASPGPEAHLIRVNPRVARELLEPESGLLELEEETGKHFLFEGGEALPIDTFEVAESGTREEIERRALPFQVGDEVLVTIEEPHMYNAGDAVARVDSLRDHA